MNTTLFKNFNQVVEDKSLQLVAQNIIEGTYKAEIEYLQSLIGKGLIKEADIVKNKLLSFTPSATFEGGRKKEFIKEYSGCIVLDIDDLTEDQYTFAFNQAKSCQYTFSCFRSPGGTGLKILVFVTSSIEFHRSAYDQLANFYDTLMQVKVDRSGKDIMRLCFISYDPAGYININSEKFIISHTSTTKNESIVVDNNSDANLAKFANQFEECVAFTQHKYTFIEGHRNSFVFQLSCNCNRIGIPLKDTLLFILEKYNYDSKEVNSTVTGAYKNYKGEFANIANFATELNTTQDEQLNFTEQLSSTPFIPEDVFLHLPELLQNACKVLTDKRERDVFLTGALTILSGCFSSVSGIYDRRVIYPNLFSFVIAPAASGKSALAFARQLAIVIHNNLFEKSKADLELYEIEQNQYFEAKKSRGKKGSLNSVDKPTKPKFKLLFIPANSSSAAVMFHINESDGIGIFCETEADTMVNAFKQEWGSYSDMLRKAFQHETISSSRKTNNEYIQIEKCRLSVALTGTPSQVLGLFSSAEDGLFSRFIFYAFRAKPEWRDVSGGSGVNLTEYFDALSQKVNAMATLNKNEIKFSLTKAQWEKLNKNFKSILNEVSIFVSEDASASVKRLGLITYRIAMVLTMVRNGMNELMEPVLICSDEDFNTALALNDVYLQHTILMFKALPKSTYSKLDSRKRKFFDALPTGRDFSRAETVEIGKKLNIAVRSVGNYLKELLGAYITEGKSYGYYRKIQ